MRLEMVGKTDPGRQRSRNEDNLLILENYQLAVVADGMGGHIDGDIASKIAVDTIRYMYEKQYQNYMQQATSEQQLVAKYQEKFLIQAVQEANKNIYIKNRGISSMDGMGTTIVVLQVHQGYVLTACVGDSRIYLLRNAKLTQITQDHSLVGELVRYNIIHEKDILFHQNKNIITRALGMAESVLVDTTSHKLFPNDIFLLCSDGLTDLMNNDIMAQIVLKKEDNLTTAVEALVEEANNLGGVDNITVALAKIYEN